MSTVRGAVEKVEEARQAPPLAVLIRETIQKQTPALQQVLPKSLDPERFSRLVLTAVKATPDLIRCFDTVQGQTSVLLSAMQLATVGLEPNTATQDAWLLPRRRNGVWECQPSYGYRGLLKLARRSGQIKTVYAEVVREGDDFEYRRDLDGDVLRYTPSDEIEEGRNLTHAFAVVRYLNGGADFVVLSRAAVEAHRAMSDSWKGKGRDFSPWTKWPEEMWKKTALRQLAKMMPLEAEAEQATMTDERSLSLVDGSIIATYETGDDSDEPEVETPEQQAELMPPAEIVNG
jgi:recombination protein RecT